MTRADWNRVAERLDVPLFWAGDTNKNGLPEPDELRALLFYPTSDALDVGRARTSILRYDAHAEVGGLAADEAKRRDLVVADLDQGAPSLIYTDLRGASATDKVFFQHMLAASRRIDEIYATMTGMTALAPRVPLDDAASQSLFRRDWGPRCAGAKTPKDSGCTAIPGAPDAIHDAYPASMQGDPAFCARLEKLPDAKKLLDPFTVVSEEGGKLTSVPYSTAYAEPMNAIATELLAAADAETDRGEAPLKAYLVAAAKSFRTNDWSGADEAWSKMNAQNSRWYLRVAPDEVLSDPCSHKAQFHLTLARIDQGSLAWQSKLAPIEEDMERALAALAGPPYKARKVSFHLPDFIQIVFNAGDDRSPMNATAGESLPNWGKVESEGRGRTVAMTNIGIDPDSLAMSRARMESLVDAEVMKGWTDSAEPGLLGTILHEATHNLGPTYTYVYNGKKPETVFGGGLSAMLEELKAETGAMFFLDWIGEKGLVTKELARQAYTAWLAWCFRHIATGVRSGAEDQPYSQLAAIQVGFLLDDGALSFDANALASNGVDRGVFTFHAEKIAPAFARLMKVVASIKGKNDKAGADALVARYVDGPVVPQKLVTERALRFPQTTYVYAVDR